MSDNEFTGLFHDKAEEIAAAAWDKGDWVTLTKLQTADDGITGALKGVPTKTTLGAKDVR